MAANGTGPCHAGSLAPAGWAATPAPVAPARPSMCRPWSGRPARPCIALARVRRDVPLARGASESLADSALLGTLGLAGRRLPASTNEWPLIVDKLVEETGVISALAFEDGILIHSSGATPGEPDALSADLDAQLRGMDALTQLMGASPAPWYRQAFDDHEMTVARDGGAGLAIWTTGGADPMTLLMNAASMIGEPEIDSDAEIKPPSDGFVVREGKGGVDALISMLSTSKNQDITGHIRTEGKKEPVYFVSRRLLISKSISTQTLVLK